MPTDIKNPPVPKRRPDSFAMPLADDEFKAFIKKHEGVVPYLYKDNKGKTTVGAGFHVPTADKAYDLGLYHMDTKRKATPQEVQRAYSSIDKRPRGNFSARAFDPSKEENRDLPNIRMREPDINRELDKRLGTMEEELRTKIPRFDTMPRSGRKALLDMQYNMGDRKFTGERWPKFYKALDDRDWKSAADQSSRKDVSPERNRAVRDWLLEAAREEKGQ